MALQVVTTNAQVVSIIADQDYVTGNIVMISDMLAVALEDKAAGQSMAVAMGGEFIFPKNDGSAGQIGDTISRKGKSFVSGDSGDRIIGVCLENFSAGDQFVRTWFVGFFG